MIISFPVNYLCNLKCKYCYFEKNEIRKIDKFIIRKILNNINIKNKNNINIFLDMKEPLLTPDIIELIISEINILFIKNSYSITIFTNWTLKIPNDLLLFLLSYKNIISFHISLDWVGNYERWLNKKQFIQVVQNITLVKKYFIYNIWYVIDDYTSKLSYNDLIKIYLFFIKLWFLNVNFYRKRIIWIECSFEKYSEYVDLYFKVKSYLLDITLKRKNNNKLFLIDKDLLSLFNKEYWCWALKNEISAYDMDWKKHFCSEAIGQWEKGFDYTFLKMKLFKDKNCSQCKLTNICSSPCILEWEFKCIFLRKQYEFYIDYRIFYEELLK